MIHIGDITRLHRMNLIDAFYFAMRVPNNLDPPPDYGEHLVNGNGLR